MCHCFSLIKLNNNAQMKTKNAWKNTGNKLLDGLKKKTFLENFMKLATFVLGKKLPTMHTAKQAPPLNCISYYVHGDDMTSSN